MKHPFALLLVLLATLPALAQETTTEYIAARRAMFSAVSNVVDAINPQRADWLVPNTNWVDVNFTNTWPTTASWLGGTARYFINVGSVSRIRQAGKIEQVELIIGDKANATAVYLDLWRQNLSGTWDRYYSENILTKLTSGSTNYITLAADVFAEVGDCVGMHFTGGSALPSAFTPAYALSGYHHYSMTTDPGASRVNWAGVATGYEGIVPIRIKMRAPSIVFFGDSTVAGHPTMPASYVSWGTGSNYFGTFPHYMAGMLGASYQNQGVSSFRSFDVYNMFTNAGLAAKPKLAVVQAGLNDLAYGTNQASYLRNVTNLLTAARDNNIKVVWTYIWPWTAGTLAQMTNRDLFNSAAAATCATFSNVICVADASVWLGTNKPSGPPGNLWDMISALDSGDSVHWAPTGYLNMARGVVSNLTRITFPPYLSASNFTATGKVSFPGDASGNFSRASITNLSVTLVTIRTNAPQSIPPLGGLGELWSSNTVLYWTTATKTNLISDGR